jgi:DNA-binding SARP family transcriptional activator
MPVNVVRSAERLLAFLALRGPIARAVVAGTLWAGVPEHQAFASMRTAIWRCNRAVAGLVTSGHARIGLARYVRLDVAETRESDPLPSLRSRELLPGWYDDWVIFERERQRQIRLHSLEEAADRLAAAGRYSASLEYSLEAVGCDPLRESAHRAVIVAHLGENNVAEAVREFRRFRRLLVAELGIEPSENLTSLVESRVPGCARTHGLGPAIMVAQRLH